MMKQTRNALLYSDLALFVMDTREGITYNDVALYKWLQHNMQVASDKKTIKQRTIVIQSGPSIDDLETVQEYEPIKNDNLF